MNTHSLKEVSKPVPARFPEDIFTSKLHCCICGTECAPPKDETGFSLLQEMNGMLDFANHKFLLYKCDKCGLGLAFPQVAENYVPLLYEKSESREFTNDGILVSKIKQFFFRKEAKGWLEWSGLYRSADSGHKPLYFLDFGTGSGSNAIAFASILSDSWKVWVSDFSAHPPPLLSNNAQIRYCSHEALKESGQKFDCIQLRHVLEHAPDLLSFLKEMRGLLTERGLLFIAVPSLYPALNPFTMRYFYGLFQSSLPYHYYFFSSESLQTLLSHAGFSCEIRMTDIPILGRLLQSRTGRLFERKRYFPLFILGIILYPLQWLYVHLMPVKPMIMVLARRADTVNETALKPTDESKSPHEEIWRVVRYVIIGGWNTLFGMGAYIVLYKLLHDRINYLILMIPTNILAITNAYIGYKLFVFKTKGNYIREYLRCYVVYGGSIALSFVLMYILVSILGLHPILAQCPCVVISIAASYIGHKRFSFGKKETSNT